MQRAHLCHSSSIQVNASGRNLPDPCQVAVFAGFHHHCNAVGLEALGAPLCDPCALKYSQCHLGCRCDRTRASKLLPRVF